MKLSEDRVVYLLEVYSEGKATAEEEQELFNWVAKGEEKPVKEHIEKLVSSYSSGEAVLPVDWEQLYQRIVEEKSTKNIPLVRRIMWSYWAAAAIALLLGTGYYFFMSLPVRKDRKDLVNIEQLNN